MAYVLFYIQRLSGGIVAVCLAVHLVAIFNAIQGGLTVAEMQQRLQGSEFWFSLYSIFIVGAVIHASIGLRNILTEMLTLPGIVVRAVLLAYVGISVYLGLQAVQVFL